MGYIHCDLKPDNIIVGSNKYDNDYLKNLGCVKLIDYGISQCFINKQTGYHDVLKYSSNNFHNLLFSSVNVYSNDKLSRKDDLISLCYAMQFLVDGVSAFMDFDLLYEANTKKWG